MKKVLLISMPFGALERPALGLSLLKAQLNQKNPICDVRYLNFAFAEYLGLENYRWINYELPYTAFAGDWLFTTALYGARGDVDREYQNQVLRDIWQISATDIERLLAIRSYIPHFLEYCLNTIPWEDYALVGFTSTFEQNIASLALARQVKEKFPHLQIVFGGANWEAEMGLELHRQFGFVDYVCSGEAENSFPALVNNVFSESAENAKPLNAIAGLIYRSGENSVFNGAANLIRNMDELPIPDFSDYFFALSQSATTADVTPTLLLETSRGCWWGAKSHCTFCGLNGGSMTFRSKSPSRTLDELEYLVDFWQIETVEAVDNILDMKYFDNVLPALIRSGRELQIFYEVKANLTRQHVKTLSAAGVGRIQPGIESLSNHVLKLMRKGTTGLRNVQLLKWGRQFNVSVEWNILYGFPGETQSDYDEMMEMLPALRHLSPPSATGPVRMDRFSPYFNSPSEFGLINVRPLAAYQYLYPFKAESLARTAYYFDYDYADENPRKFASEIIDYVNDWRRRPETGSLIALTHSDSGRLTLFDTRSNATITNVALEGMEKEVYQFCDELRSLSVIIKHLQAKFPEAVLVAAQIENYLSSLVANRLMVTDGEHYLSLALNSDPVVKTESQLENAPSLRKFEKRPASSYLRAELKVLSVN